ncbi:hypothetical protein BDN71DRAFT_1434831 [Pleurotus eryngii]|uniref:Uncharacterized protein n=1 Tax=Pleurotus eryngii TaxID=5323 RepID=A0A9P5ZQZ6_PLEER|nr:hypothetical protein BDN71DRAFT_1434831 [Pleurotus eryngii]
MQGTIATPIADLQEQLGARLVDDRVGLVDDKVGLVESRLYDSQEEMNQFVILSLDFDTTSKRFNINIQKSQIKALQDQQAAANECLVGRFTFIDSEVQPLAMARTTNYHFLLPIVLFLIAAVIGMLYALCIWKHHVTQFMHSIECGNPAVRKSVQDARLRGLY